jgi:arylsulfatase A-like enzyme
MTQNKNPFIVYSLIVSFILICPGGCGRKDKQVKHVILISIDTCRADYLSCYGFNKKTTPNIDAFAKEGVLFERCISPVPLTLPAHSSMLTGTNPVHHGIHDNFDYTLAPENMTLAERFKEHGFTTGAIVSTFVLNRKFEMNQGFDTYDDTFRNPIESLKETERRGDEASRVACEWIKTHKDENFFLFLHYYDPHDAYCPPEPFLSRYRDDLYAGEIAYTDHCIKQVLDKLKAYHLYEDALIIITGDHGEGLNDHGERRHGYLIYQESIHVPLIVRFPKGQFGHQSIDGTAGLIDLVPTICRWTGIEPPPEAAGQDLTALLENPPVEERFLYSESLIPTKYGCSSLLALVSARWKYIQSAAPELYDLQKDPTEQNNLIEQEDKRAQLYQDKLKLLLTQQVRTTAGHSEGLLDEQGRKKMESLGYVSGGNIDEDFQFDTDKEAPRDWLKIHEIQSRIFRLSKAESYQEMETLCLEILDQKPFYVMNYYFLAHAQYYLGKYQQATGTAETFITKTKEKLEGRSEDKTLLKVEELLANAYNFIGLSYQALKQDAKAIESFQAGLDIHTGEHRSKILNNLGNLYLIQQNYDLALEYFKQALENNPDMPEVYFNLGLVYTNKGLFDKALESYAKVLEQDPDFPRAKQYYEQTKQIIADTPQ